MMMNEYTPSTEQVRDAVLMSGKPFDQIVETDDPYYGYSIYDEYVEPGSAFDRWLAAHDAELLATVTAPSATGDEREALMRVLWLDKFGKEAVYDSPRIASRVLWRMGVQADAILTRFTVTPKNGDNQT